jgi:hypothetical protein
MSFANLRHDAALADQGPPSPPAVFGPVEALLNNHILVRGVLLPFRDTPMGSC